MTALSKCIYIYIEGLIVLSFPSDHCTTPSSISSSPARRYVAYGLACGLVSRCTPAESGLSGASRYANAVDSATPLFPARPSTCLTPFVCAVFCFFPLHFSPFFFYIQVRQHRHACTHNRSSCSIISSFDFFPDHTMKSLTPVAIGW